MSGRLTIGGKNFTSRLMMGTCEHRSTDDLIASVGVSCTGTP